MQSGYAYPSLAGHNVLYKGRRYWVFEISSKNPYEGFEADCNTLVYDKSLDTPVAYCERNKDGSITGYMDFGQASIDVSGKDAKDLVESVKATARWMERQ